MQIEGMYSIRLQMLGCFKRNETKRNNELLLKSSSPSPHSNKTFRQVDAVACTFYFFIWRHLNRNEWKKTIPCSQSANTDNHLWMCGVHRPGRFRKEVHRHQRAQEQPKKHANVIFGKRVLRHDCVWLICFDIRQLYQQGMLDEVPTLSKLSHPYACRGTVCFAKCPRYCAAQCQTCSPELMFTRQSAFEEAKRKAPKGTIIRPCWFWCNFFHDKHILRSSLQI